MRKYFFFLGILVCFVQNGSTQSYLTAAGVRFGGGVGMSIEQKIIEKTTIEGVLNQHSVRTLESPRTFSAVVKRHHYIRGRALNGYWGAGGYRVWYPTKDKNYGLDGVIGIEGTLFYLNTAIDYRPSIALGNINSFNEIGKEDFTGQFSVSIRYVIVQAPHTKKSKKKKNQMEYTLPPYKSNWT